MGRRGTSGRLNLRMVGVLVYDITITSPAREPGQEPVGRSLSGTLWGNPLGKPSGDPRGSLGIDTTPLLPATSGPKMGDPHPPPHTGKGRKKGRKRGGYTHYFLNFSLGENPHTPPSTGTKGPTCGRRKRQKGGGARLARGSDKIDRSHRDEFNGTTFTLIPRFPTELQRSKVYTFPWGHSTLLVG